MEKSPYHPDFDVGYDVGYDAGVQAERAEWEDELREWLKAYPEDVFIPPKEGDSELANTMLRAYGLTLDAFSADMARWMLRTLPERMDRRRRRREEGE